MRIYLPAITLGVLILLGCEKGEQGAKNLPPKTTDFGTGLNTVGRSYGKPVSTLFPVVTDVLTSFELKVEKSEHDALGGEITAQRADGHKVTAKITSVDKDHTQVDVRVAPGNRNLAELIHQRIAERLGTDGDSKPTTEKSPD